MSPDLLDILLYIFIAILYGGGSLLMKKFNKETEDEHERRRNAPSVFDQPDNSPTIDQIREEVQRKIRARTGKLQSQEKSSTSSPQSIPKVPEILGEFFEEVMPKPKPVQFEEPEAVKKLERERAELLRKREEAEYLARQAELKKQKVYEDMDNAFEGEQPVNAKSRSELLASLRNKHALQNAFLYQEIIGAPVGLREDGEIRQSWKVG